jgi:hypothetical protein
MLFQRVQYSIRATRILKQEILAHVDVFFRLYCLYRLSDKSVGLGHTG